MGPQKMFTISITNTTIMTTHVSGSTLQCLLTITLQCLATVLSDPDHLCLTLVRSYLLKVSVDLDGVDPESESPRSFWLCAKRLS